MTDAPTLTATPDPAPTLTPEPPAPAPAAPATRSTVQVPVWLLVVVTVLVVGVGAFLVGRETAADASGPSGPETLAEAVEMTAAGEMEVGDFDARTLLGAIGRNEDLDLGRLGDLLLDQLDRQLGRD